MGFPEGEANHRGRVSLIVTARLHVGNLPYSVTEEELRGLFSQSGTVVGIDLPKDRYTGRPRGFGFIEMATAAEAEDAMQKFDGYSLDNRSIRVDMAKEREPRQPGFGPSAGRQSGYSQLGQRERGRDQSGRRRNRAA